MRSASFLVVVLLTLAAGQAQETALPPGIKDTQNPKDVPPSPEQAAKLFRLPEGFRVTLFAGDPHLGQPLGMAFDARGRLWVAECFSFPNWQKEGRDRIVVFEDTDGDGRFDKRKVFWDRGYNLTSVAVGHGGVWALCAPHLLFIPDADGDGIPDGPPRIVLDGWTLKAGHNIVSGLVWGPDGWLYGRHGIVHDSEVGKPGTPPEKRTRLNCGIWRYHPTREIFEVVCHGTTNPWGLDFDEHGEGLFVNCVIGHLWHAVPGARFQRMYGQDYNPYTYELIDSTSDHLHWGGGHWSSSRGGKGPHSEMGGGHAHAGLHVYLGDNFPAKYRHSVLMGNLHGNRLNCDLLQRHGASYVARHAPDFLQADNPWFRCVDLTSGPDGGLYVADWCDLGECHDNDGVHRSSGRIFKVFHGQPAPVVGLDLARKTNAELVKLQLHANDWYVRQARCLLSERAAAGQPMGEVHKTLRQMFAEQTEAPRQLRALWALHVTGGADRDWLLGLLDHGSEYVRAWAVRLLNDGTPPPPAALPRFQQLAAKDPSGLVRLYLASTLQRLPLKERWPLAQALAQRGEDAHDRVLPLLLWYGIEPAVVAEPAAGLHLAATSRLPKLRRFIARRLAEAAAGVAGLENLVETIGKQEDPGRQIELLQGLGAGLKGRHNLSPPKSWEATFFRAILKGPAEVRDATLAVGLAFNDARSSAVLRQWVLKTKFPPQRRSAFLQMMVDRQLPHLEPILFKLVEDTAMCGPALRALAVYGHPDTPKVILGLYEFLTDQEKQDALGTLASRPKFALALLEAIDKKKVPRADLSVFTARQLQDLRDAEVTAKLHKVWGQLRQTSAEKKALIAKYKGLLTPDVLAQASPAQGRLVFNRLCAACHTLFGAGTKIGPDLTGSNRTELHYVLENLIDPSAIIGRDYQLTNIFTRQGRLVAGIVVEETERAVTMQTATERVVLAKDDIEERQLAKVSMMPEGMIEQMTFLELRNLVRYLAGNERLFVPDMFQRGQEDDDVKGVVGKRRRHGKTGRYQAALWILVRRCQGIKADALPDFRPQSPQELAKVAANLQNLVAWKHPPPCQPRSPCL